MLFIKFLDLNNLFDMDFINHKNQLFNLNINLNHQDLLMNLKSNHLIFITPCIIHIIHNRYYNNLFENSIQMDYQLI